MKERNKTLRLLLCFFVCYWQVVTPCQAQTTYIYGEVSETFTKVQLPFVHIKVNDGLEHQFTDANGNFGFTMNGPLQQLEFGLPLHRSLVYTPEGALPDSLYLQVTLNRNKLIMEEITTDSTSAALMEKVLANKAFNSPQQKKNFSYDSYNKLSISTESLKETKNELQRLLDFLSIKLKDYDQDHHLFLMESATRRKFLNKLNQKELVRGARASGLDSPSLLTLASLWQPFSIYENYLSIAGDEYISPLAGNALKRYKFKVIDTALVEQDTVYVVQYHPGNNRKLDKLSGLLYINSHHYAVQYATASPATESIFDVGLMQQYQLLENKTWFPVITKAQFQYAFVAYNNIRLIATSQNHISNIKFGHEHKSSGFDEVVIDYAPSASQQDSSFWQQHRQIEETQKDKNTYAFFDSLGTIQNFQRLLKSGHQLYYGHIPIHKITVDLNRVINFNEYEGIRAGIGAYTNNQFSRFFTLGGYYGYGFHDKAGKYGMNASILLNRSARLQLHGTFANDLAEPGAVNYAFDKDQFSAEPLRKYRLTRLDKVVQQTFAASIQPLRNLYLQTGLSRRKHKLPYEYQYKEVARSNYLFTEMMAAVRYSFGERFIRSENDLYSLGTPYPELWLQFTQGSAALLGGEHNYTKFDIKLQQNLRLLGFGKAGWQLTGGIAKGDLPYSVLYNAKGSYREASIVTHNSFETMYYNEFLSDRYIALFYAHNFGRIYEKSSIFRPTLEMLHNMGFGWLREPGQHHQINFRTMEKGYFETGFFTSDLIVMQLSGLKVGMGAGWFLRYGPYAYPDFRDNLIFKFATNFHL